MTPKPESTREAALREDVNEAISIVENNDCISLTKKIKVVHLLNQLMSDAAPSAIRLAQEEMRGKTLEECAVLAETLWVKIGNRPAVRADYMWIADGIRALKGKP